MNPLTEQPPLFTASAIARRLNRSPQGILNAIERLRIAPYLDIAAGKFYTEDSVKAIAAGMRRRNGENAQG